MQRADWMGAPDGLERVEGGSVTSPEGFVAAGVACGLKESGDLDLGILRSLRRASSALLDTASALPSEAVVHTRSLDTSRLQGVVVNAGNANAATGAQGLRDAGEMGERAAAASGLEAGEMAVSSTGVIGQLFRMERVRSGIDAAAAGLSPGGGEAFSRAICTTDRAPKTGAFRLRLPSATVTIGAAAKGAGMISPRMATMLAYLTTDAAIGARVLAPVVREAAAASFNRISVDGQMSPSDTLLVLANGPGAPLVGADVEVLGEGLEAICRWLAVQIVADGEGAEHAVRLAVSGARDAAEAEAVARAIADSPLVKAAVYGRDPNWGRISQTVGQALAGSGGPPPVLDVRFDGVPAADPAVGAVLARPEYDLSVALGRGDATATLFFSDLTHAYLSLNADYRT